VALFAFGIGCPLGVDVERIRPMRDMLTIAHRFFCSDEAAELAALPEADRERAFFLCWTRKEAYIKATGDGLATPLGEFRVSLKPGEPASFLHLGNDPTAAPLWALHNLWIAEDYAAAIAHAGEPRTIRQSSLMQAELLPRLADPQIPSGLEYDR
jgi:4'-phosphopantetheinyl transferase